MNKQWITWYSIPFIEANRDDPCPDKSQKAALHPSGSHTTFVLIFDENSCLVSFVPDIIETRDEQKTADEQETGSNQNIVPPTKITVSPSSAVVELLDFLADRFDHPSLLPAYRQIYKFLASGDL